MLVVAIPVGGTWDRSKMPVVDYVICSSLYSSLNPCPVSCNFVFPSPCLWI